MTQEDDDNADTFSDYIKTLPEHIQRLLMHVEFAPGGEQMLKHCLENNKMLKIGTDGSFNLWNGNCFFWMATDWESECSGARCRTS